MTITNAEIASAAAYSDRQKMRQLEARVDALEFGLLRAADIIAKLTAGDKDGLAAAYGRLIEVLEAISEHRQRSAGII